MLFIGALMTFYTRARVSARVCVCVFFNSIKAFAHGECLCVSQLCAQRSASTAAVCLRIHASASPDGGDWTAPVVSALNS